MFEKLMRLIKKGIVICNAEFHGSYGFKIRINTNNAVIINNRFIRYDW